MLPKNCAFHWQSNNAAVRNMDRCVLWSCAHWFSTVRGATLPMLYHLSLLFCHCALGGPDTQVSDDLRHSQIKQQTLPVPPTTCSTANWGHTHCQTDLMLQQQQQFAQQQQQHWRQQQQPQRAKQLPKSQREKKAKTHEKNCCSKSFLLVGSRSRSWKSDVCSQFRRHCRVVSWHFHFRFRVHFAHMLPNKLPAPLDS